MPDRQRLRGPRALVLGGVLLALAGGLAAAVSPPAAAAASPAWARAAGITLPAGALTTGPAGLIGVGCTGGGFCVAAGYFQKSAAVGGLPMVVTRTGGGVWRQARQLKLPKSAATAAKAAATDAACTSSTSCQVVGRFHYAKAPANNNGFIAVLTAAGWSQARVMAQPPNAATPVKATLSRISCATAGNCGALGTYVDTRGNLEVSAFFEKNGTWGKPTEITPPAGAAKSGSQNLQPFGLSCPAPGDCVAAGKFLSSTGLVRPFLAASASGVWGKAAGFTLPGNAKNQAADLNAVSCASVGNCVAVGNYTLSNGRPAAYSVTETGGTWGAAQQITPIAPGNTATPPNYHLFGLSCPALGSCVTAGFYTTKTGLVRPLSDAYSGAAWQGGAQIVPPADASTAAPGTAMAKDVTCWSAWRCVTVGSYLNKHSHQQAFVAASP